MGLGDNGSGGGFPGQDPNFLQMLAQMFSANPTALGQTGPLGVDDSMATQLAEGRGGYDPLDPKWRSKDRPNEPGSGFSVGEARAMMKARKPQGPYNQKDVYWRSQDRPGEPGSGFGPEEAAEMRKWELQGYDRNGRYVGVPKGTIGPAAQTSSPMDMNVLQAIAKSLRGY